MERLTLTQAFFYNTIKSWIYDRENDPRAEMRAIMGSKMYLEEIRSLTINPGRAVGKTTVAYALALENPKVVIVTHNRASARRVKSESNGIIRCFSYAQLEAEPVAYGPETIFIFDDVGLVTTKDKIFDWLEYCENPICIFLGRA